jgi:hypothetical protein
MLLAGAPVADRDWPGLPSGATYAVDVVGCPDGLTSAVARMLFKTAIVDDLAAARALVTAMPDLTAVTRDGDVYAAHFAAGGSGSQPSLLEIQAAYDDATTQLSEAVASCERLAFDISRLEAERLDAQRRVDVAIIDVQWNGLWEAVRIASLADAYEVDVAPHNYAGHLASMISAHFCAAVPNFRIMEIEIDDVPWKDELVTHVPVIENGELVLSNRPGWGTEVNEAAVRKYAPPADGGNKP